MERRCLRIGDKGGFSKKITEKMVWEFAELTGDYSRIHVDKEFAKSTRYRRPIAHGLIAGSFISTVMGTELPGSGTIFLDQQIEFLLPVYYDDTITATVELCSVEEKHSVYIAELYGECMNQREEIVCRATAHQMLPKEFFEVL